jgi:hypothetical protein
MPIRPPTIPPGLSTAHIRLQHIFVYSTYSAVGTEDHLDKSIKEKSNQKTAYLSSAVGGSLSTISFEDKETTNLISPRLYQSGGIRGKIKGFSRVSRRNLLRRLASINRQTFRASKVRQKDPDRSYLYREHKVQIRLSGDRRMFGIPIEYAVSEITRGVGFE